MYKSLQPLVDCTKISLLREARNRGIHPDGLEWTRRYKTHTESCIDKKELNSVEMALKSLCKEPLPSAIRHVTDHKVLIDLRQPHRNLVYSNTH